LRFRREGEAQRYTVAAVMDAQTAQPDQPSADALRRRPAPEAQCRPFGLVIGHQGIALGPRQHAILEKIHHPRIGMQNGQLFGVGHGDRIELKPLGDEVVTVQDESLPVPVAGL